MAQHGPGAFVFRGRAARRLAWVFFAGTALAPPALAQTGPEAPRLPTREEIERDPVRAQPDRAPRLTVEDDVERAPCALDAPAYRDIRFTLRSAVFEDLKGLSAEALRPAWEGYAGTDQPIAILCDIRDRAAPILREAGYIAAVEIPEQRIADGDVRFQVLMAKLVAVRVRGDAGRAERTLANYLEKLTGREVFNRYEAERYLLLARDMPGYDVRLALRSAEAGRGEVIGEVTVVRTPAEIDFNVQNYGAPELGRWGAMLRGQVYGLTGLGDRTTLALFSTPDVDEQQTVQLGHDFRVGGEGLTFGGRLIYARARPDLDDDAIRLDARTWLATAEASIPFVRTEARTVRGTLGLDLVDQRIELNDLPLNREKLRVAFARVEFDEADPASFGRRPPYSPAEPRWRIGGSLELRQGLDLFGASEGCGPAFARCLAPGAVPPTRFEGDPTATVVRVAGAAEFRPAPLFTILLGARAQYSESPLFAFEEYSAGNYTIGRGYDPGILLGDSGIGVQAELRYGSAIPPARGALAVQPYAFFDAAWVSNEERAFVLPGNRSLASAGGGVRVSFGDQARLDAALAVPLERAGLQTKRGDVRFLLSFTTRLWPWSFR